MILEAIYSGDFYPSETVVPKSEKYRNALRTCEKIMDQLAQRLTKEDYDLVETLLDQSSIAQCEESECHFKVGFSAGLLVQQEAMEQMKKMAPQGELPGIQLLAPSIIGRGPDRSSCQAPCLW